MAGITAGTLRGFPVLNFDRILNFSSPINPKHMLQVPFADLFQAPCQEDNDMKSIFSPIAFAFVLMLGSGTSPAIADELANPAVQGTTRDHFQGGPRNWMEGRMADQLKLTDAQKASLKAIRTKHQDTMIAKRKAGIEARRAFFEASKKPETSPETLKALHRTMSDLEFDRRLEHRAVRQEMHALLTPDQREKVARMEGFKQGMRMARGGRWEGGDSMGMWSGHPYRLAPTSTAPEPTSAQ